MIIRKATAPRLPPGTLSAEKELRSAFLAIVERIRDGVRIREIEEALRVGDLPAALDRVDWTKFSEASATVLRRSIERAVKAGARLTGRGAPTIAVGIAFDLDSSFARAWIESHAAERVVQITNETRAAVRNRILRGFQQQKPTLQIAREVRDVIGLTRRMEAALERFAEHQAAAGLEGKALERAVARYRDNALRQRAQMIARTEVMTALAVGDRGAWNQRIEQGIFRPIDLERVWRATDDTNTCELCAELNGQVVGYEESFTASLRARPEAPVRIFTPQFPPAHPNCRCTVVTRPRSGVSSSGTAAPLPLPDAA